MISKLSNKISIAKNILGNKISQTNDIVKNTVLAILLTTGIGAITKAEANLKHYETSLTHKVVKGDTIYKLSKKYGINIDKLKELNNIGEDNIIQLGKILNIKQDRNFNISKEQKTVKNKINKIQSIENSNKSEINLGNNVVERYYRIYDAQLNGKIIDYTISPSDKQVIFTGEHKYIKGRPYIKIILTKDRNISGFVSITAFSKENKMKISQTIYNKKETENKKEQLSKIEKKETIYKTQKVQAKKSEIRKKEVISHSKTIVENKIVNTVKESDSHALIDKSIRLTVRWNGSKRNKIHTNEFYSNNLHKKLQEIKLDVISIKSEEKKKQYLLMKIDTLKGLIDYPKIKQNATSDELFDHCATLVRKTLAFQYYADISYDDFKNNHVNKNFNGDLIAGLEIITNKLGISENISKYNMEFSNNSEINILEGSIDLITKYEGFTEISEWDAKQYSWGYGTKAPKGGIKITKTNARIELLKEIEKIKYYIESNYPNLNINQKISLISFFYNNGTAEQGKKTLLYNLENMGTYVKGVGFIGPKSVANSMKKYIKSGGKKLEGLERRRKEEADIFLATNNEAKI